MKYLIYAAVFTVFMFFLSSCELEKTDGEETETEPIYTEPEPEPYPLSVAGTEIEKSPESVVCLSPALTEILYEMGFGERIKGRGSYCDYPPVVKESADMGSSANPDIEKILTALPEIVLTQTPIADKDLFRMEQAGIKTLVLPSPKSLNDLKEIYSAAGLIFTGAFTGAETGEEFFSPISKACDNAEVLNIGKFIYITESMGIAAGDTLESAVLSCFGTNLAQSGEKYAFDNTLLIENQPDIILLSNKYTLNDLEEDEVFSQLDAVKSGRIIYIDNMFFERPTKRIVTMLESFITDFKNLE